MFKTHYAISGSAPATRATLMVPCEAEKPVIKLIESYRDVVFGLTEMYLSAVGMRTNEIMRVLTVISAIFIPLTFVAGVYGMNFDNADGKNPWNLPELHQLHGYFGCLLVMASIAVGQAIFFKRKKWL